MDRAVVAHWKSQAGIGSQPERVGVLLVNLGTPDTADARACGFI